MFLMLKKNPLAMNKPPALEPSWGQGQTSWNKNEKIDKAVGVEVKDEPLIPLGWIEYISKNKQDTKTVVLYCIRY